MSIELREQTDPGAVGTALPGCRFCSGPLRHTFVDLGMSPLCESYVPAERLGEMEPFYPLHARVCEHCLLVQLEEFVAPEDIFSEYAYFSSYSDSWVAHARRYVESAIARWGLNRDSLVVEIASNDGYLLQHVVDAGSRRSGSSPPRTSPRPLPSNAGSRPWSGSSAASSRRRSWRAAAGGSAGRQQRLRSRARPQRLHGRA